MLSSNLLHGRVRGFGLGRARILDRLLSVYDKDLGIRDEIGSIFFYKVVFEAIEPRGGTHHIDIQ